VPLSIHPQGGCMLQCPWCDEGFWGGEEEAAAHIHQKHRKEFEDFQETYDEYVRATVITERQTSVIPGFWGA